MAFRVRRKKHINAIRVAMKIIATIVSLWVGGFAYNVVADVLNGTASPFYKGLKLVGFTVVDITNTSGTYSDCLSSNSCAGASCGNINSCITGQSTTSLLAVIGVLAIFWIAFEFIDVRM